jgi:hypothetical protein
MANLTRCDQCSRLSDEKGVGYIGRDWIVKHYNDTLMVITAHNDYCSECIQKLVADHRPQKKDRYDE